MIVNNLITSYPTWTLILCPLIGLAYALLLYFREKKSAEYHRFLRYGLFSLRFAAVAFLVFLLLGPLIRNLESQIEPPIVVIASDNSSSLILGADSTRFRESYPDALNKLISDLGEQYEIATYSFGQDVSEGLAHTYDQPVTDLSELFQSIKNRYANRNLGAIVLASDGIYNRGSNPRYATGGLGAPVYTIALGDTVVKRDAKIAEVALNRIAFLGNQFPIEVELNATRLTGKNMTFLVDKDGVELSRETIQIESDDFTKTLRILLDAKKPGRQQYNLRIIPINGEAILANNTRTVFIDVIDSRQKVLILANSPHPDIQALRSAIASNENYQVDVRLNSDFSGDLGQYNLVILHQIPSNSGATEQIRTALLQSAIPTFAVVGSQTAYPLLQRFGLGVDLFSTKNIFNDVSGYVNTSFSAFRLDDDFAAFVKDAPPLQTPFGEWKVANSSEVIIRQAVGSIRTEAPLLLINRMGERKTAVLLGEGIWRWRLYDFATEGNHQRFDQFIGSLVQYLSLKADQRPFRLQHAERFMETERVVFTAELYNQAFEAVNDGEVNIIFTDGDGKAYPFTFSRTDNAYRLDAGILPVGSYTYHAKVNRGGELFEDRGRFSIEPFALEAGNLTANHNLLYTISANTGGSMYYTDQLVDLSSTLLNDRPLKPVSYSTEVLSSVLNLRWPFVLLLLLLSVEWFLRKRSGSY